MPVKSNFDTFYPQKTNFSGNTFFYDSLTPHSSSYFLPLAPPLLRSQAPLLQVILKFYCLKRSFSPCNFIPSHNNLILMSSLITTHMLTAPKFIEIQKITFTGNLGSCFQMFMRLLYSNIFQVLQSQISKIKLISPHTKPASFLAISLCKWNN